MNGFISVNGNVSTLHEAKIPPTDRGLTLGDSVFDVLVAFGNVVLDLDAHIERLKKSASHLGINFPWTDTDLKAEIEDLLFRLGEPKAYIRIVLSRGSFLGLGMDPNDTPNRYIYVLKAPQAPDSYYTQGIGLHLIKRGSTKRGAHPKVSNYLESIMATKEAKSSGFEDVLWANSESEITEAATSNIFFIGRHGNQVEITTPPQKSGILMGITRSNIIELLRKATIPVEEAVIYSSELPRFDEAFLCSTVRGLVPVNKIGIQNLHSCRQNSIFRKIEGLYSTWVETQVGYRVDWNTGERPLIQ